MKVNMSYVRAGMVADEPVYTPDGGTLLLQHGTIISPRMLVILKLKGVKEIAVSEPDSLYISPSESLAAELIGFFHSTLFKIAPEQTEGNINDSMAIVAKHAFHLLQRLTESEEIMSACVEMKLVNNDYLFCAAKYCCVYSVLVAAAMGMTDDEVSNIAAAALLADLGLCEMPFLIGLSRSEMTAQYDDLWKEHPLYGYYFSKERGISHEISELIYCHHEKYDGRGYPRSLVGDNIPMGSKIIKLCSDYYKMVFEENKPRYEVIEYFYSSADGGYDSRVIDAFIMNIPVYPLGSLVRLSNQEVGVVINIRKNIGPKPLVRACYNNLSKPITQTKVYDLNFEQLVITEVLS